MIGSTQPSAGGAGSRLSADTASGRLEELVSSLTRLASRERLRRSLIADGSALSPTDAWLMRYLCERGPARMSELAAWQGVDRSTMTTEIRRLERAELVARETDPDDRRAVIVRPTPAGRAAHEANRAAAAAVITDILATWTEAERDQLIRSFDRFVSGIAEYLEGAGRE